MIVGSNDAPAAVAGTGAAFMRDAVRFRDLTVERLGEDILVTGYPVWPEHRRARARPLQYVHDCPSCTTAVSRREYFRMGEAGILRQGRRIELIEGEIVQMPPTGGFHAGMLNRVIRLFKPLLGTEAVLAPQNPIRLGDDTARNRTWQSCDSGRMTILGCGPGPTICYC